MSQKNTLEFLILLVYLEDLEDMTPHLKYLQWDFRKFCSYYMDYINNTLPNEFVNKFILESLDFSSVKNILDDFRIVSRSKNEELMDAYVDTLVEVCNQKGQDFHLDIVDEAFVGSHPYRVELFIKLADRGVLKPYLTYHKVVRQNLKNIKKNIEYFAAKVSDADKKLYNYAYENGYLGLRGVFRQATSFIQKK